MPKTLVLRVQSKWGRLVVSTLYPDSTLSELQAALKEKTKCPPNTQKILLGYPPHEIESYEPTLSLSSLHIHSGESLILEELPPDKTRTVAGGHCVSSKSVGSKAVNSSSDVKSPSASPSSASTATLPAESTSGSGMGELLSCLTQNPFQVLSGNGHGKLVRRVVPADNSCLFRSISILLTGGRESNQDLRELAAGIILSNPDKYSSAILGQPNQDYVRWLQRKESWGGAIELRVFSEHYQVELDVVDIQTQRIDRFGEDQGYSSRALLLYDGIHYDPLVRNSGGGAPAQGVFPLSQQKIVAEALHIASAACKVRQFTDVSKFKLRCLVCQRALGGQVDAMNHAKTTGHSNFGEV